MPAISDLFRAGWAHDAGCQCVPCLQSAFRVALEKAIACGRLYKGLRDEATMPDAMNRARTEWTQARQETVLADHALRAAEDRDRLAEMALRNAQAATPAAWNPREGT